MKNYLQQTIDEIRSLVRFDSSLSAPAPDAPFGKGAADCLKYFLSLAERLGFQTKNYDNYVGEVLFGEGEEFAILCHLDVVPAGDGWNKDPFGGEIADGKIWGRGTTDDKGPAVCSLFALKALKDEGFVPKKKIKLIVGCNEECGWGCIDHYNQVAHMPETGFSPDADFPVIYAEKGILQIVLRFPLADAPFTAFSGGGAGNMVCDKCYAQTTAVDPDRARSLGLQEQDGKLFSFGKSAHGSTPELGKNAMLPLLQYFANDDRIRHIIDCLFLDRYGLKSLFDETGNLTMSPNVVSFDGQTLSVTVDIRYPASLPESAVLEKLAKFGVGYEILHEQAALYHEKDSPLIQTLLSVYEECTGISAQPIAIGGGTYARALKNGVGFGPEMPGDEATIHQPNEYIALDRIELLLNIYKRAIEQLTK